MTRPLTSHSTQPAAFSLVEMLTVISGIGILATIALVAFQSLNETASSTVAKSNAQKSASLSLSLSGLDAAHVLTPSLGGVDATLRFLNQGVTASGGSFEGQTFVLSGMTLEELEKAASYLQVTADGSSVMLVYNRDFSPSSTVAVS